MTAAKKQQEEDQEVKIVNNFFPSTYWDPNYPNPENLLGFFLL